MLVDLATLRGAFELADGLSRPQWAVIGEWIDEHVAEAGLHDAWCEVARQWLAKLKEALGPRYEVRESENFLLLSGHAAGRAGALLDFCEFARAKMLQWLEGIVCDEGFGKQVVLAFADRRTYYAYISQYYPEGHFGGSGGIFLRDDYLHLALTAGTMDRLEPIVTFLAAVVGLLWKRCRNWSKAPWQDWVGLCLGVFHWVVVAWTFTWE